MANASLTLRYLGFCGVDDSIEPEILASLSRQYSWLEWGVLLRPDMEGKPRYATFEWIEKLSTLKQNSSFPIQLAAHLCGRSCEELLEGNYTLLHKIDALGFARVQVNATKANNVNYDTSNIAKVVDNICNGISQFPQIEFIIQTNQETLPIKSLIEARASTLPNISFLYDSSCGTGVSIDGNSIPVVHSQIRCGYAGGIGPDTIHNILTLLSQTVPQGVPIWIDMESSLREFVAKSKLDAEQGNFKDTFSINNCGKCLNIAKALCHFQS